MADRYGADVLGDDPHESRRVRSVECVAEVGMVIEDPQSGFVGAVVRIEGGRVELQDRRGRTRVFPLGPGFLVDGRPVILTAPLRRASAATRTASGSVKVPGGRARVAAAGRIYVEGRHDAELVEQVWGDDLRIEGVVVEYLGGIDDLGSIVDEFGPGPTRRLGVLVDHLVPGSKESRIADAVRRGRGEHTLVVGHPYVDIWQAVKPVRGACRSGRRCRAPSSGSTASVRRWAGRTAIRPTLPGRGSESEVQSGTGPTWNLNSSAGSKNSSTL